MNNSIKIMAMPLLTAFCSSVNAQEVATVTEGEAVDLGLSVNWAGWNIGANSPEESGGLYGWADPTGERTSTDFSDYPSATPPDNISGTEYDIATAKWGAEWSMPTVEETKKLSEECTWEWTEYKSVMGMMITGPNGNCIFLPAAASRTGESVSNQVGKRGCYWTETLYPGNSNFADYLYFYDNGHYGDRNTRRYIGHSVRAVTTANFNFGPTVVMTAPDDEGVIGFHSRRDIMLHPACPDNVPFVKAVLDSFFDAKEQVRSNFHQISAKQMERQKNRHPVGFTTN